MENRDTLNAIADDLEAMGYLITDHLLREATDGSLIKEKAIEVARHFQSRLEEHAEKLRDISENLN